MIIQFLILMVIGMLMMLFYITYSIQLKTTTQADFDLLFKSTVAGSPTVGPECIQSYVGMNYSRLISCQNRGNMAFINTDLAGIIPYQSLKKNDTDLDTCSPLTSTNSCTSNHFNSTLYWSDFNQSCAS